jgi:hypothetical protein
MKCAACQREVPDGSAFCPGCGASMTGDAPNLASRMKSAVNRNPGNQPAEDDLWVGTYSPKAMAGPAIGLAILTVIAIVVGTFVPPIGWMVAGIGAVVAWLVLAFVVLYRQKTVNYRLTTFRLFHESGLLARTRDRIEVIDINDVNMFARSQTWWTTRDAPNGSDEPYSWKMSATARPARGNGGWHPSQGRHYNQASSWGRADY